MSCAGAHCSLFPILNPNAHGLVRFGPLYGPTASGWLLSLARAPERPPASLLGVDTPDLRYRDLPHRRPGRSQEPVLAMDWCARHLAGRPIFSLEWPQ